MRRAANVLPAAFLAVLVAGPVVAMAAGSAPPSVETFFRKPAYGGATLSPNGRYLAVVAPIEDHHGLIVLDLETHAATKMKSPGDGDVTSVSWQNDERLLVGIGDLQAVAGEPTRDLGTVAINRDGTDSRVIERGGTSLLRILEGTNSIILSGTDRSRRSLDLFRVDTVNGHRDLLTFDTPGNVVRWVLDFDGVPRAAVSADLDHDESAWYVRKSDKDAWTRVERAPLGRLASEPLQFDPDGRILYVAARRDAADRAAIYEYAVDTGTWKGVVVRHPVRDLDQGNVRFVVDYRARKLLGLLYADDRPADVWFDPEWAKVQKSVDAALPGTVNRLQRRGDRWIVVSYSDRDPGEAYVLDAKTMRLEKLFAFRPWIDPAAMSPQKWVRYAARDGMTIPALLTLPGGAEKRFPLVVAIHGGPYVQANSWGYNPEVQFFASRGYAVLQPQYRGTEGFGWKLHQAGYREWGDKMQDDLEDGVKWAVAQGIADSEHVCFYGASYGGYAAAWGAIKNAKLIKCAIAYAGITSIDYMFDNAQTDLSLFAERSSLMAAEIGDPKTDRARFRRVSPLANADKVAVPVLLAYGASDRRVPLVHGSDFHGALERAQKEHEWVVYADEGHGFNKDENVFDYYARVDRFLAKYLLPAAQVPAN